MPYFFTLTQMKTLYTNAVVYDGGRFAAGEFAVDGGCVVPAGGVADRVVDLGGRHVVPGLVDVHVHLREPGFSQKETIATGTAAAARGGYTTVCSMPNLNPAPDTPQTLRAQTDIIRRDAVVRVVPYGCITIGQRGCGRLVDFAALAPEVVGFSDDGRGVQSDGLMEEAMRRAAQVGKPVVAHCEVDDLLRGGYIHDGEYCRAHGHKGICSESEWRQVERDIALAEKTGCQYHVCHVSTRESVELVRRAKARGLRVSCETAPHYLLLCDEDLQEDGRFKMNPPLRDQADQDALIEGLLDGTIDMLVTDHAPHSHEEKAKGLEKSAMGVVGLEMSFAASYTHLVKKGILPLEKLVELMHTSPMRRFGCGTEIAVGQPADLTVFDLNETYTVDPEKFLTMGRATPFTGTQLTGACKLTMIGGEIVWKEDTL